MRTAAPFLRRLLQGSMYRATRQLTHFVALAAVSVTLSAQTSCNPETGLVLVGKVVTMNEAGDVLPNARVWLADGKIMAIARAGEALPHAPGTHR